MADSKMSLPGSFGGLMRYDSEFRSKIILSPGKVIAFIAGIIVLVVLFKVFWPVA